MSLYIDTRGKPNVAVGICDRCRLKYPNVELRPDRDSPGLVVCDGCNDTLDPYKLAPRKTEDITLRYPRPEEPLT